jgi:hypothetical protein
MKDWWRNFVGFSSYRNFSYVYVWNKGLDIKNPINFLGMPQSKGILEDL